MTHDPRQPWRPDQPPQWPQQPQYPQQQYQQQPYGQQSPGGRRRSGGSLRPPRRTGRKILAIIAGAFGLLVMIGVFGAAAGGGKSTPTAAQTPAATKAATASPAATRSSAPARPAAAPKITYVVTGSSADITYGPEGSDLTGSVPMRVTKKLGHALYYSIQAQLNGSGEVTVKILVSGKVISEGHASGGYNIAQAEISQDPLTGKWEDTQQS